MVTGATRRSRMPPLWLAGRTRARLSIITALFHAWLHGEGDCTRNSYMKVCALALGVCRRTSVGPAKPATRHAQTHILARRVYFSAVPATGRSVTSRYEVASAARHEAQLCSSFHLALSTPIRSPMCAQRPSRSSRGASAHIEERRGSWVRHIDRPEEKCKSA